MIDVPPSAHKILIIEDEAEERMSVAKRLILDGYQILTAKNGMEGLAAMREWNPTLVLLDVIMPTMDGFDVLKVKATDKDIKLIPTVIITSMKDESQKLEGFDLGAIDYLTKPFSPTELSARVKNLVAYAAALRKAEEESVVDVLTTLHNRRYFDDKWGDQVIQTARYGDPLSLIYLDIDHFKSVNDIYGHEMGDIVLKAVAEVLRTQVRASDLLARIGGEEFCIGLSHTGEDGAAILAEKIREAIELNNFEPYPKTCTISLGVAATPDVSPEKLLEFADKALYRAKKSGRNTVEVWKEPVEIQG